MSRQQCYDVPRGDTICYDIVDDRTGYRQPTYMMSEIDRYKHFRNIRNFTFRENDIFLVSYPKTGTQWLWDMLTLMFRRTSVVDGEGKFSCMLEARPTRMLGDIPGPRVINTHVKVCYTPQDAVDKKIKTILLIRNPKDVAVSFYNHTKGLRMYEYEGQFHNYLHMFMRGEVDYGSYPEYLMEWQQHIRNHLDIPVHIVYYEKLHQDCVGELSRLREFLALDVDAGLIQEISRNCSFNNLRENKRKAITHERAAHLARMLKPGFNPFRKGRVGDWKSWFTVSQSEMFDTWWIEKTRGLDMFNFTFE